MPVNSQFSLGVLLLSCLLFPTVSCSDAQRGALRAECRDRYFLLTIDQAITTKKLRIEAIDATGIYPINMDYSATCGYTYSEFNMAGFITLRASFYSCHTEIQDDQVFSAEFNVISTDHLGGETVHHVAKTCTLSLPWTDREVLCEENYMEVSVRSDACALRRSSPGKDKDSKLFATLPALTGWQLVFMEDEEDVGMSVDEARAIGYGVTITDGRVVFRSAYVQHHTDFAMIDGISTVEIHTTMILRHKWMVKMLDLSAACTINLGGFDPETLRVFWEIPTVMAPLVYDLSEFASVHVGVGVEGQLLDEYTWRGRGYSLDVNGSLTCLSVPMGAEGGHRRSLVINNTYHEFYSIYLYYEHLFREGLLETRHRMPRACSTPQLPRYPYTIDQTVPEEYVFTVYLGDFPWDVELVAVALSGESYTVSEAIQSGYAISMVRHPNGTHGYVLKVPFEDPVVLRMYLGEGLVQYSLEINYTLSIMPQHDYYYHLASVMALIKDAFPPDVQAACTEGSIIFQIPQRNLGHMWEITVGPYPLTPELAARRGYFLQNTGQSLTLEVPVFTIGFIYEDITLNHFFGTFEVLTRDAKTLDIQKSTAKRCLFNTDELIVCSTDGVMTAVVSLAVAIPPMAPSRTTLLDANCGPQETDATRVLFAFGVNTCGTRFLADDHYLVFENEIMSHREFQSEWEPIVTRDSEFRVTVQCFYEANSTDRLFVDNTFKSETPGFGTIKESSPKEHGKEHQYTPTTSDTLSYVLSSYGVQSGSQPNGYSATEVHTANVVPSIYQGSSTQHVPSSGQPTHAIHPRSTVLLRVQRMDQANLYKSKAGLVTDSKPMYGKPPKRLR
ncbi:hypothetical protein GJAV_G00109050 [Gymnothorax javanicus]|nr:hypothetical protein GJAV_G00109050 [Gymnothorax javanicus]